ncbi:MAG: acyl-CoA/acyl-ACP dehydrogenase [Fimbriimonadaceae bacterium]|nr:acyl-CoA/acyl-ACP dehydrogenase [Fimbriimonadaceae bacterium]
MTPQEVLHEAETYLREEVGPSAADIDLDPEALRKALRGLCDKNLMALKRPMEFGGPALPEKEFREFQEASARYSGSLSFLMTQHQSAVSLIAKCDNDGLKAEYLPRMAGGERLLGIGISQLRRAGDPMITAERVEGGYVINGSVPWITGWSFYPEYIVGATLPDGKAVYGIAPLETIAQAPPNAGTTTLSEPMRLCAMESAQTVGATLRDWFIPDSLILFIKPSEWARRNDMINIVLQGHYAIGCARAGLDVLERNAEKKPLPFLPVTYSALLEEFGACRAAMGKAQESGLDVVTDEKLRIRAWAIELAVRCAHAAIVSSSGAANIITHPAQRIYREALVYSVSAQTTDIMEATLSRLTRDSSG